MDLIDSLEKKELTAQQKIDIGRQIEDNSFYLVLNTEIVHEIKRMKNR